MSLFFLLSFSLLFCTFSLEEEAPIGGDYKISLVPEGLIYLNHPMFGAGAGCFHESLARKPTKYQNPLPYGLSILEGRVSLPHAPFYLSFSLSFHRFGFCLCLFIYVFHSIFLFPFDHNLVNNQNQ